MIFDTIVIAVLLISALHAFWRGFIREVLTIFGAIGGLMAALAYGDNLRPLMDTWLGVGGEENAAKLFDLIPMTLVSAVLAYAAIFIVIFGVLSFISHLIAEQVRALGLGAVDRTLGVVFGLIRGLLILGIFYLPVYIVMDQETKKEWFKESRTHVYIEGISGWLESILPENMMPFKEADQDKKKAVDADNGARETLEEMDVLKPAGSGSNTPTPAADETKAIKDETGYDTKERNVLDTLIDKGVQAGMKHLEQ